MEHVTDSMRYKLQPHVVSVIHGVDTILLDLANDQYFTLNQVGSRCWALLADGVSVDDATMALVEEFDVSPDTLRSDLNRLFAALRQSELIVPASAAS
jgi:hypothetical protein